MNPTPTTGAADAALVTEKEAAKRLGVSAAHLARLRLAGTGPAHIRIGDRIIRYRASDLDAFIAGHRQEPAR